MVAGGAQALGDSRLANLGRLRAAGLNVPLWLLRPPAPDQAADCVRLADVSLASELETCEALAAAARAQGREHRIVAMVDLGDLREGMMPADLPAFLGAAEALGDLAVEGVGVNLTCYGAVIPTAENLGELVSLAEAASRQLGRPLTVSGGNSGTLWRHLQGGGIPTGVTNLRVGESILLGVETMYRDPLPGLHHDAIVASAPVVECLVKPSLPRGDVAQDAFGNRPAFTDRGERRRAICALGRQDAPPEGLTPTDPRVEVLGASSDHLILDVDPMEPPPRPGDLLGFTPNYAALLQLFTSPYVHKVFTPPA
jgi:predicted amino acid racemase